MAIWTQFFIYWGERVRDGEPKSTSAADANNVRVLPNTEVLPEDPALDDEHVQHAEGVTSTQLHNGQHAPVRLPISTIYFKHMSIFAVCVNISSRDIASHCAVTLPIRTARTQRHEVNLKNAR